MPLPLPSRRDKSNAWQARTNHVLPVLIRDATKTHTQRVNQPGTTAFISEQNHDERHGLQTHFLDLKLAMTFPHCSALRKWHLSAPELVVPHEHEWVHVYTPVWHTLAVPRVSCCSYLFKSEKPRSGSLSCPHLPVPWDILNSHPVTSYVPWGKLLNLPEPQFLSW